MHRNTIREGISVQEAVLEPPVPEPAMKFFVVLDDERQERLGVVIRRVNSSLVHRGVARRVVRFSKREHSPRLSDEIWVSTVAHYRKGENLEGGQYDPIEGRVKMDATPFCARRLLTRGFDVRSTGFKAQATFAGSPDPWVFCTAFCPVREREAYRLARRISSDYDTITDIPDVNTFALELGVDFALALDAALHTKVDWAVPMIQSAAIAGSGFERFVYVDHGPVAYEDISGTLKTGREPVELQPRVCFTKPKAFSYQSEYRFALRTVGEPTEETLRIPVSDALRECTSLR